MFQLLLCNTFLERRAVVNIEGRERERLAPKIFCLVIDILLLQMKNHKHTILSFVNNDLKIIWNHRYIGGVE